MTDKTYTEDDLRAQVTAAVAEATSTLQAKIDEIELSHKESEIEERIAEARAEGEAKVAELQTDLDKAVLEAEAARSEHDALKTFLDETAETEAREATVAALMEERKTQVLEVASFPEGYVTEEVVRRWAEKDETEFAALLADYKAASGAKPTKTPPAPFIPKQTAMVASDSTTTGSVLRSVGNWRDEGFDPRTIR